MARIVLARHGESVWHREDRYVGVSDIDLTERGHAQARELAAWATSQQFSAVWTSPLRRCRETAEEVGRTTGLTVGVEERLTELDFGVAEGASRRELEADHAEAYRLFLTDPVAHHFPSGEDPQQAAIRTAQALTEIAAGSEAGRVLVVAHATVLRLALCRLLGLDLGRYRSVFPRLTNGSVSEISLMGTEVGLLNLNVPIGSYGDSA